MKRSLLALPVLLLTACAGVTDPGEEEYTGLFASGFETESFTPCGSDESWWVTEDADLRERYRALGAKDYQEVYVVVRGDRSPEGKYGHLGAYTRELSVREVVTLRAAAPGECGKR